jgi:hypothetical protein
MHLTRCERRDHGEARQWVSAADGALHVIEHISTVWNGPEDSIKLFSTFRDS